MISMISRSSVAIDGARRAGRGDQTRPRTDFEARKGRLGTEGSLVSPYARKTFDLAVSKNCG
jgi:hypothetical protein